MFLYGLTLPEAVWHSELMQADKRGKGVSLTTSNHALLFL